ncbi:MAG: hypothetical protein C6I00_01120 [Nitratiruptor sp.]|nr:hypothetical protein [Nitratiruptor sp.]NPA83196.1 hypothetical protein [Campylobacterota bacterium]
MKLEIKAMFFDAARDYLPHYRSFWFEVDERRSIGHLLERIAQTDEEFDYDPNYPLLRINSIVVPYTKRIDEVAKEFGREWVIDPISKYRSTNDLLIDQSDMDRAFALIEPYASGEDRLFFYSNKELHYASATLEFDKEYIGDAILVTAYRMIKRGNPHKEEILQAISEGVSGLWSCEFENLIYQGRDYGPWIEELKSWVQPPKLDLFWRLCSRLTRKKQPPIIEGLEGVPTALYHPTPQARQWLLDKGALLVPFPREWRKGGESLIDVNPELAYRKGAAILLDAMDNGAELFVTSSKEQAEYFRSNFGHFERSAGREIYLDIIALEELEEIGLREEV